MATMGYIVIALLLLCALEAEIGLVLWLELRRIRKGRERIHERFSNDARVDGKCQCPYCARDVDALSELAADYEMQLHSARQRLGEV